MNEITILIIGIGIGYFWAMYRVDNIKIHGFKVTSTIDAREFWQQMEKWKAEQEQKTP